MDRAIKIANLAPMDETSIQILRVISLHIGDQGAAYVDYKLIAKSLNIERDTVRKSVNKMIARKILKKDCGKLSIPNSISVMG